MHHQQPRPTPAPATPSAVDSPPMRVGLQRTWSRSWKHCLNVIERETELVRAGKVAEAMALETSKTRTVATLCQRRLDD